MLKIAMLSTGEEVLHGDIVDTNAAWLAEQFYQHGLALTKRSTVGDAFTELSTELMMLSLNYDIVLVNGGLGPTSDDITAEAAAEVAGEHLKLFEEWLEVLDVFHQERGIEMPESNLKQAMLPENAVIIANPIGTACGFKMLINESLFYFTPGVPKEFKLMVENEIIPDLKQAFPDLPQRECSRLYSFGLSESAIEDRLSKLILSDGFQLGYRSYLPFIEVKLFGPAEQLKQRTHQLQIIYQHLQNHIVSIEVSLLTQIGLLLSQSQQTISIAEQSTKGWLNAWFNEEPLISECSGAAWTLPKHQVGVMLNEQDPLAAALALAGATRDKCATKIALATGQLIENAYGDVQVAIALSTERGEWGQWFEFKRAYEAQEYRVLIATIAADMLRRYLEDKPICGEYNMVSRLKELYVPTVMLG